MHLMPLRLMPLRKWVAMGLLLVLTPAIAHGSPAVEPSIPLLERSWAELNHSLDALDRLLQPIQVCQQVKSIACLPYPQPC